jgi:hypothetical protein
VKFTIFVSPQGVRMFAFSGAGGRRPGIFLDSLFVHVLSFPMMGSP